MSLLSFILHYKWIILFYVCVFLLIYLNRKKFEIQASIIALYRTKIGIRFMNFVAKKFGDVVKRVGYVSIYIGFIGLVFIIGLLVYEFFKIFLTPTAPAAVAPLLPGISIGGIYLPFFIGIIAIFIAVVVHEFSHGVTAISHNLKIKNTGFGIFAIFPIAFVEPNEEEIKKKKATIQYSIFAMGPFANIVVAVIALILISFLVVPIIGGVTNTVGVTYSNVSIGMPAEISGMKPNMTITEINNIKIKDTETFSNALNTFKPNQTINITADNKTFSVVLAERPDNPSKPYLGIIGVKTKTELKEGVDKNLFNILIWFYELLFWLFVINLGLGLMNLYPIFITDGARMLKTLGEKYKRMSKYIVLLNKFCVIILILHLLYFVLKAAGFGGA